MDLIFETEFNQMCSKKCLKGLLVEDMVFNNIWVTMVMLGVGVGDEVFLVS